MANSAMAKKGQTDASSTIPLKVVENHNDALPHIYRLIGGKKLPFENNILVHFDSHPDLKLPANFDGNNIFDTESLFGTLDIASWILPAVFAGHISAIIWLKLAKFRQFHDGKFEFFVGKLDDGKLKVTLPHPYFLADGEYADAAKLADKRPVTLIVTSPDIPGTDLKTQLEKLTVSFRQPYILDIDLDYFSVVDPFRRIFSRYQMELLQRIYVDGEKVTCDGLCGVCRKVAPQCVLCVDPAQLGPQKAEEWQEHHQLYLTTLRSHWAKLGQRSSLDTCVTSPPSAGRLPESVSALMSEFVRSGAAGDVETAHTAGLCLDADGGLPHEETETVNMELLKCRVQTFSTVISQLPPPGLITIARSSWDEYCPRVLVDDIQQNVLDVLACMFRKCSVDVQEDYHHYFQQGDT